MEMFILFNWIVLIISAAYLVYLVYHLTADRFDRCPACGADDVSFYETIQDGILWLKCPTCGFQTGSLHYKMRIRQQGEIRK